MGLRDIWKLWRFYRAVKRAKEKGMLEWKKLAATIIGAVIVALGPQIGLSEEAAKEIAAIIAGYLIGQGIADLGKGKVIAEKKLNGK